MADRLERRGWPNGRVCSLCRCHDESAFPLLFKLSIYILKIVKHWLHIHDFDPSCWGGFDSVEHWWTSMAFAHGGRRNAMTSLLMLVSWEIWNKRNVRTLKNTSTMSTIIFGRRKSEAGTWVIAGAKHLCLLITGE
jgi:hypothetical protein